MIAIAVSALGLFVFLASAYYVLTNVDLTLREVLPGAIVAAVILEATFQLLPVYVDSRSTTRCSRRSRARRSCSCGCT